MAKNKTDIFYFKKPIEIIRHLKKSKKVTLIKKNSPLDDSDAYMKANGKRFQLAFQGKTIVNKKRLDIGQTHKKVEIQQKNKTLICEDFYLWQHSPPEFNAVVDFFYSKGYSKKKLYYYKLLIPLSEKHDFHREIERRFFTSEGGYIKASTEAIINADNIFVSIIKDEKLGYFLSLESKIRQRYDIFSEKTHAIKNAIGYLTGHLAGNQGYYFVYTKKKMEEPMHFYFCNFRDEIKSRYTPVHSNPYGYLRNKDKLAKKYYKDSALRNITVLEFSTLCQRLHDSIEFSTVVLLILESSIATLLFMPGGFAIALETLSDIIIGKTKLKLAPIKDKSISRIIRKEFTDIVTKYCSSLDPDDLKTLTTRINQINQTTNKKRLKAPFDLLKIDLLEEDLAILEARNDFLHGRIPDITKTGLRTTTQKNRDLYYASMRFYTLLNILILKWIGFDGRVVNYPKINESFTKIKLKKEEYFRKV